MKTERLARPGDSIESIMIEKGGKMILAFLEQPDGTFILNPALLEPKKKKRISVPAFLEQPDGSFILNPVVQEERRRLEVER